MSARDLAGDVAAVLAALPEDPERARRRAAEAPDLAALLETATRHRVAGVLVDALGDVLPAGMLKQVRRRRAAAQLWSARVFASLREALAALGGHGLRVVVLKGPALAARLYPDPSQRPCADLDLLVAPEQLDAAVACLKGAGWSWEESAVERYSRAHAHDLTLRRCGAPPIELHFRALHDFDSTLSTVELLDRAVRCKVTADLSSWVLAPEDELVFLCAHAAKHTESLGWLYDLKLFLARAPALDMERAMRTARRAGLWAPVAFALDELHRRLGVARSFITPPFFSARAALVRPLRARVARSHRKISLPLLPPGAVEDLLFHAALCDGPRVAAQLAIHRLGWALRRRLHHRWPALAPTSWGAYHPENGDRPT